MKRQDNVLRFGLMLLFFILLNAVQAQSQVLESFDDGVGLSQKWNASGQIKVSRNSIPAPAPQGSSKGPSGNAAHFVSEGKFAFYTKVSSAGTGSWKNAESISFWIYQASDRKSRIDFLAMEADKKAMFWRKCEVSGTGWQRIEMPLKWFRWENLRLPRWSEVVNFGIRGDSGLDFWIDGLELVDNEAAAGADYTADDLVKLAFPGASREALKINVDSMAWVMSDAPECDTAVLHAHLVKVRQRIETDIPAWKRDAGTWQPPRLLVFRNREAYRDFFVRFGEKLLATVAPPESGGYHVNGIAVSYYDPAQGSLRPVFAHEFVHSCVTFLGLHASAGGEWFQEGMANLYQLRSHPQAGISRIIGQGLDNPACRDKLAKLCSGGDVPMNRYWQAMTVVDYLMNDEGVRDRFNALLERMEKTGSVDMQVHLEQVYGVDLKNFEDNWMDFVKRNKSKFESGAGKNVTSLQ